MAEQAQQISEANQRIAEVNQQLSEARDAYDESHAEVSDFEQVFILILTLSATRTLARSSQPHPSF